tara:strand:- start:8387 stop:9043 length:657 start_codon:yes stop_codon:yes gene_type:complete
MKMKKTLLFITVLSICFAQAQKNIYENQNFDELSKDHKSLAIIPFITNLALKSNISEQELKTLKEKESYAVQNALETYFIRGNKKKKYAVEFQNTKNTNALLAKNNITSSTIDVYTTKELSKLLNVDGIISGNIDLNVLLSKGVSTDFNFMDYFNGNANYGRIGIKVSDGTSGKLLWKYEKEINKKSGKNTQDLIDGMMKKATRKFPYDKERLKNKKN